MYENGDLFGRCRMGEKEGVISAEIDGIRRKSKAGKRGSGAYQYP
jgi:hypothetical protein